jgi:hypothetical protein
MIGGEGHGGKVIVENCYGEDNCDDGIEINSFYDILVKGCEVGDCHNAAYFFCNVGGMINPDRQRIVVENFTGFARNRANTPAFFGARCADTACMP